MSMVISSRVLPTGRYAFWNSIVEYDFVFVDLSKYEITELINESVLQRKELAPYVLTKVIESYEKGVLVCEWSIC